MILIDGPYVSEFLKETLYRNQFPVVRTLVAGRFLDSSRTNFIKASQARQLLKDDSETALYTNSENALEWLYENIGESKRVQSARLVKDKIAFRETLKGLHSDYLFAGHDQDSLKKINPTELQFPLILKPSVGFFSLGVQRIEDARGWSLAISDLDSMISKSNGLYPDGVLNNQHFVLEAVIPGDEFAVDCYFDHQGQPVVLNLMQHLFASEAHMNDRVYYTSGEVITKHLKTVTDYLEKLGPLFQLVNFSAHIELRIHKGEAHAIEINPLRFGGWCSTADTAFHAWGMNIYELLMAGERPDWKHLVQEHKDIYALLVLDNSSGVAGTGIKTFDYDRLMSQVAHPLELRKTNFRQFPLFGFLMCRISSGSLNDLDGLLHSDLREFVKT